MVQPQRCMEPELVGTVNIITYNPDESVDLLIIQIKRGPSGTAMADSVMEAITPKTWIWYWAMRVKIEYSVYAISTI